MSVMDLLHDKYGFGEVVSTSGKLKPRAKAEWCRRLRSGQYTQGTGCLANTDGEHCCLGVASEMAFEAGIVRRSVIGARIYFKNLDAGENDTGASSYLPYHAAKWMAADDTDGISAQTNPHITDSSGVTIYLANLNDDGFTFEQIAEIIEEHF